MKLEWKQERPPSWDAEKARIVGGADAGIFDARFARCREGDLVPGDWWRVSDGERVVGYGWMDVVWGDAEILLATAPEAQGSGVGAFILENLEKEARKMGLTQIYNVVRPTHPDREAVSGWLSRHGFEPNEDGSLFRAIVTKDGGKK